MVRHMARSGCRYVFMGLETTNDSILEGCEKTMKSADSVLAIEMLKDYGIETMGSFIIGWPAETRQMIKETIRFSKRIGLGGAQFSILTPYPGTRLHSRMERQGRILHRNWDLYDTRHCVFRPALLNPEQLEAG